MTRLPSEPPPAPPPPPASNAQEPPGWLALAMRPTVVRRGLMYALVVGAILITINHGDAIIRGDLPPGRVFRMGLTVLVPYTVSTLSSVGALRQRSAAGPDTRPATQEPPAAPPTAIEGE